MVSELDRDPQGFTRLGRIDYADSCMAEARRMVAWAHEHGGFEEFADDFCDHCATEDECGRGAYLEFLYQAEWGYAGAGLGLLADRVERLHPGTPEVWQEFDQANATTTV